MNKKIITILLGLLIFFASCAEDEVYVVTEEWKAYQRSLVAKAITLEDETGNRVYAAIKSESGMGSIYIKDSDYITRNEAGDFEDNEPEPFPTKAAAAQKSRPNYDTDLVLVRYEGWYYKEDDSKYIFDKGTEGKNNASQGVDFQLNGVVDGFKTLLQNMKVGEEKLVCIPYQLGYGETGNYDPYYGTMLIPPYTTLFFNVKLLKNITAEEEAAMN